LRDDAGSSKPAALSAQALAAVLVKVRGSAHTETVDRRTDDLAAPDLDRARL